MLSRVSRLLCMGFVTTRIKTTSNSIFDENTTTSQFLVARILLFEDNSDNDDLLFSNFFGTLCFVLSLSLSRSLSFPSLFLFSPKIASLSFFMLFLLCFCESMFFPSTQSKFSLAENVIENFLLHHQFSFQQQKCVFIFPINIKIKNLSNKK